jgi:hypothetical protein
MRRGITIGLAGLALQLAAGGARAQDPNNAYIPDIQNGVFPLNTTVTCRDVVVTNVLPFGLFVQEPAATGFARSGIWCYTGTTPQVQRGDKVHVKGRYIEFFDLSELDVPAVGGFVTLVGSAPVPAPPLLDVPTIHTGSPTAEDWESVLVKVDSVKVIRDQGQFGQYTVIEIDEDREIPLCLPPYGPCDTLTCDDRTLNPPPRPPVNSVFDFMTGICQYDFSEFKLNPRDNDDFDWAAGEPAPGVETAYCTTNTVVDVRFDRDVQQASAEDELNYFFNNLGQFPAAAVRDGLEHDLVHLTVSTPFVPNVNVPEILDVSGVRNEEGTPMPGTVSRTFIGGVCTINFVQTPASQDSSQVAGQVVTVTGIVTGDNRHDYIGADGSRFYIEMPGGGQRSGLYIFDREHLVLRGDLVKVAGQVLEFNRKTEISIPYYVQVMSSGNTVPGPDVVSFATLANPATAEPYEGVYVRVNNAVVADTVGLDAFGEWTIRAPAQTDTVWVGDEGLYFYVPDIGDPLTHVQGPLDYSFGEFKIQPRTPYDIGSNGVAVEEPAAPVAARTALRGASPNPFNPATTIRFGLRAGGPVSIAIYDLAGRLVRSLAAAETFPAGEHALAWDGRSDAGQELGSGVYLLRFEAGEVESSRKITLVK